MKLVISGASGYVGTETLRQALTDSRFTSVVALARSKVTIPKDLTSNHAAKFQSVVISDYATWTDEVRNGVADADGVIWTAAITPSKQRGIPFEEVTKVCKDNAVLGFRELIALRSKPEKKLRFVYMSGSHALRDRSIKPALPLYVDYIYMRGEAENEILALAQASGPSVEGIIAKPGIIFRDSNWLASMTRSMPFPIERISVGEVSAAMLESVVNGWTSDTMLHVDLEKIGSAAMKEQITN